MKVGDTFSIYIDKISFKDNIRLRVETDEMGIGPLMSNIKQNGLLQSIGVAIDTVQNKVWLVHGNRRLEACKKLGHQKIEAKVVGVNLTDVEFASMNLSENFHREDNSVLELGRIFKKLRDKEEMSISEISVRNSVPKNTVETALNLIDKIPIKILKDVEFCKPGQKTAGKISAGSATSIISRRGLTPEERGKLFKEAKKKDLTANSIEIVTKLKDSGLSIDEALVKQDEYIIKKSEIPITVKGVKIIEADKRFSSWTDYVRQVLTGKVTPLLTIFD